MAIPHSVLVADDEHHIRTYVRLILRSIGVQEVHEAANGEEAVRKFEELRPDAVFMDINMPGMTGLDALPRILDIDPDAVVLMLTGHASRHLVEQASEAGASHYIRKDTPQEDIQNLLKAFFEEDTEGSAP